MINKLKDIAKNLERPVLFAGIIIILLFLAFKFGILSLETRFQKDTNSNIKITATEITAIKFTQNLAEQIKLYTKLIERVGAIEAQENLFRSGLPFNGETHLLNHAVGEYLYKNFGAGGLVQCRDYFLSSCYHGFLVDAIADGGMTKVAEAFTECYKEGPSVSSQCAHAIGHGFLANSGYRNLTKALKTCDEAVATMPGFPAFNCYDGIFMENIWAVHDGEPSPDRWIKENDIQYPCNDKRINDKYILACWSNQPSLAFQFFKGDVKKVADNLCEKVENTEYQRMCFDGLARQIHPLTRGKISSTFDLCGLMPSDRWNNFCLAVNASSAYAVGDRTSPFDICATVPPEGQSECYGRIFNTMRAYKKEAENLKILCSKISDVDWRQKCERM